MHSDQAVEESKRTTTRRPDAPKLDDKPNKRGRRFFDVLVDDPDDPAICRSID